MELKNIMMIVIAFLGSAMVYALDWQREQDDKLSKMDKLIERQSLLSEMQVDFSEKAFKQEMKFRGFRPTEDYETDTSDGKSE